ncbi:MAG TPA: cellulase family glycosylhydrolase [Verrucomicrobiae bacterium]|nr:cellulase family glycosylhydrolase [Verrucomicrobiae bacterium]
MSIRKWLQRLSFVALVSGILAFVRPANGASSASDNACNSPYNGSSWSSGQNGGTGFGAWSLFQSGGGTASFSTDSASDNGYNCSSGGAINGSCGKSWAAFANNGAIANARRVFTGSPGSLQAGQNFSFSIDNGYVDSSGGAVGVALENAGSNTVWEFRYAGGNATGTYSINDGSGSVNTGISYTDSGLTVVFTLTSPTNYSVTITAIGGAMTNIVGALLNPSGGQVISQFRFYNNEPLSGNGCNYNGFLNAIGVSCPPFTVSAPTNQTVCAGNSASFSVTATGAVSPGYQWQVSADGGTTWNAVSTGTGGTTSNYTTTATVAGDNGKLFDCVVTDGCGNSTTGSVATLTVVTNIVIITQPTAQTANYGGTANFSVSASAAAYQWYKGPVGSGTSLGNGGSIGGATSATLSLSSLTAVDNGANFYVVVSGCGGPPQTSVGAALTVTGYDPFLKANGVNIRNGRGTGDIVPLHGANFGAWLLMEGWMCPMDSSGLADDYSVIQTLDTRFGVSSEQSLIRTYQYTWITTNDLDNIRALGMNAVRVPFWWGDVETLSNAWRADAFDRMDWVVSNAWQRGIYSIIDFHGVPGGQNISQSTGRENQNQYWTSTADQTQTAMIWSNVAAHFRGDPAVAGYDLMNEPSGAPSQLAIWNTYSNLYQTVRSVDPDHICIMEGTWSGTATNGQTLNWQWDVLPSPSVYNWSNVVYSMHAYPDGTSYSNVQTEVNKQTSDFRNHQSWNVPDLIGEFQGYGTPASWQYAVTQFNTNGMNWATWAYKASNGTVGNSWGVYDPVSSTNPAPNIQTDSSSTISNDWSQWSTVSAFGITSFLQQYLGGPLGVADSYTATSSVTLVVGAGSGVLANDVDINRGQSGIQLQAVLVTGPSNGLLTLNANGSFSYTPNSGFVGSDTFRYRVYDGYQYSVNVVTVSIQVTPGPVPTAPTGVTASGGDGWVSVTWNSSVANGYNVYRATVSGGPYTNVASGLVSISYTDSSVIDGTTYDYVVTAYNAYGESSNSVEVSATPLSAYQQWQIQYFGSLTNPAGAANVDADGDGFTNLQKFLAGTNPTNPATSFRITSIAETGGDVVVRWMSGFGVTNALQVTAGDGNGNYDTNNFADIFTVTNTTGMVTNYLDSGAISNGAVRYYRVRIVP